MRLFIRSIRSLGGFTLVELLTVMAVIAILAALVLSIAGYANKKAAIARATAEIQALSTGCESYKTDNGTYPHQPLAVSGTIPAISGTGSGSNVPSDVLYPAGPNASGNPQPGSPSSPGNYARASLELYQALSGDLACSGTGGGPGVRNYIADLKQDTLGRYNPTAAVSSTNTVYFLSDPFGNSYGYSTACATAGGTSVNGYNPTYDLWCTAGQVNNPTYPAGSANDPALSWIKNWQ